MAFYPSILQVEQMSEAWEGDEYFSAVIEFFIHLFIYFPQNMLYLTFFPCKSLIRSSVCVFIYLTYFYLTCGNQMLLIIVITKLNTEACVSNRSGLQRL